MSLALTGAGPRLAATTAWKRLGGYKDTDHHIKFRMSDLQRHLQRKAKDGRPCG